MAINLLDVVKNNITPDLLEKLSFFIEEDTASTNKAINVIIPTLVGGVANESSSLTNASQLYEALQNQNNDGSILKYLSTLFGGGSATHGLIDDGEQINSGILGNKMSAVADWIASFAGIKTGAASGLMNMLAPVVLGAIGKQLAREKSSVSDLMNLLSSQTTFLKGAIPIGLKSILGFKNLNLDTPSVSQAVVAAKNEERIAQASEEKPLLQQLLPWLILLVAGIIGLLYLRMCNTKAPAPPATTPIAVQELPILKVDSVKSISLPEGKIEVKAGSFLDKFNTAITSTAADANQALTFDNINFAKSSADLTDSSKTQLKDLVKVLKAYPTVSIKIEGHTDSRGDEAKNKQLSQDRAASVKKYLVDNGINSDRLQTAGFGSSKPIADNSSDEGRAKNRRIEAIIIKK